MAGPYPDLAALQRPSLRLPFLKTAIQQRDIMRAEHPQHPPGPRGAVQRRIVVDDEAMAVSEHQCLHAARELVRRWQHVRRCVEIGRASCRVRGCQYVEFTVVAASL